MTVIGVLVQTEIGDQHQVAADLRAKLAQRALHDPVLAVRLRSDGVLLDRDPEEDHGGDAETGDLHDLFSNRLQCVLRVPGHGSDRKRIGDPLLDEERRDEIAGTQRRLRYQTSQRFRPAETPEAGRREMRHD